MTLLLCALADDSVIQVIDRRLTWGPGQVASEIATKAIYGSTDDTIFSVTYTGHARAGRFMNDEPIDHWLLDRLSSTITAELTFPEVVTELSRSATDLVNSLRKADAAGHFGVTFVLAGFGPRGPFAVRVTNQEGQNGETLATTVDGFSAFWSLRNSKRMNKLDLLVAGQESSIRGPVKGAISRFRRKGLRMPPERRAAPLVAILRLAASQPQAQERIGRNCMSITLLPCGVASCTYHPERDEPRQFLPHMVTAKFAMRDLWFSTSDV